jgi:DNA-binding PadR family transcriptional regulator
VRTGQDTDGSAEWAETLFRPITYFYSVEIGELAMTRSSYLGAFEEIVLLALVQVGEGAYGMTVRREIEERSGRSVSIGAVYSTLDRLERKGYVSSQLADPDAVRRGRARRYFKIEQAGEEALHRSREVVSSMWEGLETRPDVGR